MKAVFTAVPTLENAGKWSDDEVLLFAMSVALALAQAGKTASFAEAIAVAEEHLAGTLPGLVITSRLPSKADDFNALLSIARSLTGRLGSGSA